MLRDAGPTAGASVCPPGPQDRPPAGPPPAVGPCPASADPPTTGQALGRTGQRDRSSLDSGWAPHQVPGLEETAEAAAPGPQHQGGFPTS